MELSYPGSEIDVIEIDPVVTQAAFEAMNLPRDTTIRSFNSDARNTVTDMIQRKRKAGIALTTLGFGGGNYNDHLLEQLADLEETCTGLVSGARFEKIGEGVKSALAEVFHRLAPAGPGPGDG